jgi:hypothetical protein
MKSKGWLCAALAGLALGSASFADAQTSQTGMHAAEDEAAMVQTLNVTVGDLEDMEIYSVTGDEVGGVEAVLVDGSGQPVAVVADVGGFLGMGQRDVVLGLDQLSKTDERLTVAMSKEQIEALPEFDMDD